MSVQLSPSVGDILMLSQLAWKIGRAFTQGKKSAPQEFGEVERESNGLSDMLKQVAESIYSDNSILMKADDNTRSAVSAILDGTQKTLTDLESIVERYRVIQKKERKGGFVVERTWSDIVIANYTGLKWTSTGGTIIQLRDLLHLHTNTLNLTMQAMQSKSLPRLELTAIPLAESIAIIHEGDGDLGSRIDDLHRTIVAISDSTPSLAPTDEHDLRSRQISVDTISTVSSISQPSPVSTISRTRNLSPPSIPYRNPARPVSPLEPESPVQSPRSIREDSAYYSMGRAPVVQPVEQDNNKRMMDWGFENGAPAPDRASIGAQTLFQNAAINPAPPPMTPIPQSMPPSGSTAVATPSSNTFVMASWQQQSHHQHARRESNTVPHLFTGYDDETDSIPGASSFEPVSPFSGKKDMYYPPSRQQNLPPPALPPNYSPHPTPATPSSFFSSRPEPPISSPVIRPNDDASGRSTPRPQTARSVRKRDSGKSDGSPDIGQLSQSFEKSLFRNAAILCDVKGTMMEYARHIPDEPDPRYNTEMKEACSECRIFVIRKRENRPHGGTKVISSIWAISNDGKARVQQRLPEDIETVPYCSYFQPEKVSLPPTRGDMTLRFHPQVWGDEIEQETRTNWINYILESEEAANNFQSAIFGRTLLGSFRTTKTTVIHEGLKGAFAFEEQFANIEVLRFWEDDGITTAGASGGVLALMHLGSNFGEGWARWWMNSSKQQVRIKDEGTKFAKLKGIDIRTVKPGETVRQKHVLPDQMQRRATEASLPSNASILAAQEKAKNDKKSPIKRVNGIRIEFKNEEERGKFVQLTSRIQLRMIPLPDI